MFDFKGRTALVAGGAQGIGRAAAEALVAGGARVYLADLNAEITLRTAHEISTNGGLATALRLDVTAAAEWDAARDEVLADRGRLDYLVYTPGIGPEGDIFAIEPAVWQKVQDVNLTGFYLGCRCFVGDLVGQRSGAVVAIGSASAVRPRAHSPAYCVSKAGLLMLVRCLAQQHAKDGVRFNMVSPGWVDTPGEATKRAAEEGWRQRAKARLPFGRLQEPAETGAAVAFLCSDSAASITGINLPVDQGLSL